MTLTLALRQQKKYALDKTTHKKYPTFLSLSYWTGFSDAPFWQCPMDILSSVLRGMRELPVVLSGMSLNLELQHAKFVLYPSSHLTAPLSSILFIVAGFLYSQSRFVWTELPLGMQISTQTSAFLSPLSIPCTYSLSSILGLWTTMGISHITLECMKDNRIRARWPVTLQKRCPMIYFHVHWSIFHFCSRKLHLEPVFLLPPSMSNEHE